jgi:hypothetical protein
MENVPAGAAVASIMMLTSSKVYRAWHP